jgi:copper(I)-binding protein
MLRRTFPSLLLLLASATQAQAQAVPLAVDNPWARAIVKGQGGTGAFMVLTAREPLTLLGATSPAAGIVEIHQMKMEGDVMKMRAVDTLALPTGQPVTLSPGGYHFMLMDLKAGFQAGSRVPLTLQLRDARGKERSLALTLPVSLAPPGSPAKPKP